MLPVDIVFSLIYITQLDGTHSWHVTWVSGKEIDKAREKIQDPRARALGVPTAYESNHLTLQLNYPKV